MEEKVEQCYVKLNIWVESNSSAFSDDARLFCTCATLRRYAVARNGDYEAALKNLKETIIWRRDNVPVDLHCTACDVDENMHCFYPVGLDAQKRLVVYASMARAKTNDKDVTVAHMVHTLEHAWRQTEAMGLHHQWVWVVDFASFTFWHAMQGSTSTATLTTFSSHMPERMGTVILLNPPGIFDLLLTAVKAVIDARTMSKVHILRCTPETIAEALEPHGIAQGTGISQWMRAVLAMPGTPGSIPPLGPDGVLDQHHISKLSLPRKLTT